MPITIGDAPINISESQIAATVAEAMTSRESAALRGDSADIVSPGHVAAQRAMVVHHVQSQARRLALTTGRGDARPERVAEVAHGFARGLGLHERDGHIYGMERGDAGIWEGEGIATEAAIVRPAHQARAISEMLPTRSIDPSAQIARVRGIGAYTGSADVWESGMTQIPRADYTKGTVDRPVTSLVTSTMLAWEDLLYGGSAGYDPAAEAAEAANRVLLDTFEHLLVEGHGQNVQGLRQLKAAEYVSTVDYSDDATTIGEIYADLIRGILAAQESNDDRGTPANALFISTTWIRAVLAKSNLDSGGSMTGGDILMRAMGSTGSLGRALQGAGIDTIVPAPSLNSFGPKASDTTYAGAFVCALPEAQGLRKIVAVAPSPVRTASSLAGDETLWAMRIAGVEAPIATSVGVLHAKVR